MDSKNSAAHAGKPASKVHPRRPSAAHAKRARSSAGALGHPSASAASAPERRSHGIWAAVGALAAVLLLAVGCTQTSSHEASDDYTTGSQLASTAMVASVTDDQVLLVDQQTQTPFFPTIPESGIVGLDGRNIDVSELEPGNIVSILGDGIMLQSYPGQYPGITSIEVIEEGTPDDAAAYADITAQVLSPTDESQAPIGFLAYSSEFGQVTVALNAHEYSWTVGSGSSADELSLDEAITDPNGLVGDQAAEALVSESADAELTFDFDFQDLQVTRTALAPSDGAGPRVDLSASAETVVPDVDGNGSATLAIDPGYLYSVSVTFAQGHATYAFVTSR